jgi:hypothetical protein
MQFAESVSQAIKVGITCGLARRHPHSTMFCEDAIRQETTTLIYITVLMDYLLVSIAERCKLTTDLEKQLLTDSVHVNGNALRASSPFINFSCNWR